GQAAHDSAGTQPLPEGGARLHAARPAFAGSGLAGLFNGHDFNALQLDRAALAFQSSRGYGDRTLQKLHLFARIDGRGRCRWLRRFGCGSKAEIAQRRARRFAFHISIISLIVWLARLRRLAIGGTSLALLRWRSLRRIAGFRRGSRLVIVELFDNNAVACTGLRLCVTGIDHDNRAVQRAIERRHEGRDQNRACQSRQSAENGARMASVLRLRHYWLAHKMRATHSISLDSKMRFGCSGLSE